MFDSKENILGETPDNTNIQSGSFKLRSYKSHSSRQYPNNPHFAGLKRWMTVKEAAKYLSVSPQAIYNLTHNGTLTRYTVGNSRSVRLCKREIDALLLNSIENTEKENQ